ncbi:MAG: helix-turn-helix transcriptional regulator, partial [Acinetobacter sp.]
MQVLKTKLSRPSMLNDRAMQRPQLLSQMVDYCQSSLVFIHAAAGYGKTTLMYQLSEALLAKGKRVSWLTLDSDDNDPIRLYQYLGLALLGLEHFQSVSYGHIHKQHIIELTQEAAEIDADLVLFIDELEALENPECLNILWWLYQSLPENCHLVMASRVKPSWSFAKEYLLGHLKWVTESHLSIKQQESSGLIQYLQQQSFDQLALSTELAEQLIAKTEGWFTGIQLTNLYLKEHQDIQGFIQNLSGEHHQIVNYLSEQVFLQQAPEIQQFLLQISVLRKVNLALVTALTGNSAAQQILDVISQKGLFIQALDEQRTWYRVHHLFRDFLQAKFKLLQPDAYQQMHSKAAEWFKQQHYLMEAIYHAQQVKDQQLILSLLNLVCRELILEGRHYTLLELVKQLPDSVLVQNPNLLYDIIWTLVLTHQVTLANHYLQLWHSVDQHETLLQHEDQLGLAPLIAILEDK